jgi:hypothetical protein
MFVNYTVNKKQFKYSELLKAKICKIYLNLKENKNINKHFLKTRSQLYTPILNSRREIKSTSENLDPKIDDEKTEGLSQEEIQMVSLKKRAF